MNKGIAGFIIGLLAVLGGAFVATLLLKKKLTKDNDDSDFDSFDEPVDDEEFEHFFNDDDLTDSIPDASVNTSEDDADEDEQEEQL